MTLFYQFPLCKKAFEFSTSHVMLTLMPTPRDLQAVTGYLYLIEGAVQETNSVPGLLVQPAPAKTARGRNRDSLFVHLSLSGQPADTAVLSQDLLDIISQHYFKSTGSVTAALRQAVLEANQRLLRLNLSGSSTVREGAVSCAVLRGQELFMVQAGEALALLGHNFGVERLPARPANHVMPMGRTAGIDIRFFHHRLQIGDMLLLADPRIAYLPTDNLAAALVDTELEYGLEQLKTAVGSDSARLMVIEFTDELIAEFPPAFSMPVPPETVTTTTTAVPPPQPRRDRSRLPVIPQQDRQPQPERPLPTEQPFTEQTTLARQINRPNIDLETSARKATSEAAMGLSRFTGWLADLLAQLRPARAEGEKSEDWAIPAAVAIIIPLIVALVVGSVYIQRGRGQRFAEIKVEMGQNLGNADAAGEDKTQAMAYYNAVVVLAAEGEALRPGDPEIDRLRQLALHELDRLGDVTRLTARPYHTFDETVELTAVTLQEGFNGGIYTLDRTNSQVFHQPTSEDYFTATAEPEILVFNGQAVGSHVVGSIRDIIWRPMGSSVSRDGLAMLDSTGALLTYYPNFADLRAVPLGFATDWQLPLAVTTFAERLYILDPGARQIWKYFPDGDGFLQQEDERTLTFSENPELETAVDIAIYSEDGSLVVLYGDGRLRYYDTRSGRVQWDETHLLQNGLGSPLLAPTAVEMVGRGLNASIFVADPGSGRLIEISRGGTVLAQYRASDEAGLELFSHINDFAVTKTPLRIYVTSGNVLYLATQE